MDDILPVFIKDTQNSLDAAALASTQIDLQKTLLELTTRVMGKVAYDVRSSEAAPCLNLQ